MNGALSLLRSSIPGTVRLIVKVSGELPPVTGGSSQLQQLLMSILTNAVEAIASGSGTFWIEAGVVDSDNEIIGPVSVTAAPPRKYVRIEVKDTGCGMDKATLARIYDPFFSTKFMGRGLGLATARGIIEAQRGAIRVTSEPGRGTSFAMFFPVASGRATTATGGRTATAVDLSASGTVLVVDDEERPAYGESGAGALRLHGPAGLRRPFRDRQDARVRRQ